MTDKAVILARGLGTRMRRPDADGRLVRVIEKADEATLASLGRRVSPSMNCWRFTTPIFEACRRIGPSPRGELEITDAVRPAIGHLGVGFEVLPFHAAVVDPSCRADGGPVSRRLAGTAVRL